MVRSEGGSEWFLNYVLRTDLAEMGHTIQMRIAPKPGQAVVLEGLLVNSNVGRGID